MIVIPIQTKGGERGPNVLVLVLERENLDRMKAGDPLDFQPRTLPPPFANGSMRDLDIIIAYEEQLNAILDFQARYDLVGLMRYIERGRQVQPGDARPPVPLRRT